MGLWIRSQDKERLVKVEYLEYFYKKVHYANEEKPREEHYNIGAYISNEQFIILGEYATEERTLEVLDEIQKKIILINLGHDFGSPMVDLKNPTYIYEMPKE